VLYAGKIVEQTDVATLFNAPAHVYTRALMAATPRYDRPEQSLAPVRPEVIAALNREIDETDKDWAAAHSAPLRARA
jgi:peptide/nickel transport system ATP-binding protein